MAEEVTSGYTQRQGTSNRSLSILAQSANQAADILGVKTIELLDYPDNRMDSVNLLSSEDQAEELENSSRMV